MPDSVVAAGTIATLNITLVTYVKIVLNTEKI